MCEIGEKVIGIQNLSHGIYQILSDSPDRARILIVFGKIQLETLQPRTSYTNCVLYIPWANAFRKPMHVMLKDGCGWDHEEFIKLKDNHA